MASEKEHAIENESTKSAIVDTESELYEGLGVYKEGSRSMNNRRHIVLLHAFYYLG